MLRALRARESRSSSRATSDDEGHRRHCATEHGSHQIAKHDEAASDDCEDGRQDYAQQPQNDECYCSRITRPDEQGKTSPKQFERAGHAFDEDSSIHLASLQLQLTPPEVRSASPGRGDYLPVSRISPSGQMLVARLRSV